MRSTCQLVCRDYNTIGALVGYQHRLFVCVGALTLPGLLKRVEHADHVLGDPVLEADDFGGLTRASMRSMMSTIRPMLDRISEMMMALLGA
ncbi:MAG: hypothetical protein CM15mP74_02000 [Halieaceae bacterium]|nr:MAG: hypothetical protein CM15mP74_02000 [Halieaceae bacterium]